jgi:large subunit ribosomal protein L17
MRHLVDHRKLGRTAAHRKAMLSNMVTSLFERERITTTGPKAKEARRRAERLITRAKKGHTAFREHLSLKDAGKEKEAQQMQATALAHWRQAGRVVKNQAVLRKLFDVIAPQFLERNGGYTRILHLQGGRVGDNASTVLLELVGFREKVAEQTAGKRKKSEAAAPAGEASEVKPGAKKAREDRKKEARQERRAASERKAESSKPRMPFLRRGPKKGGGD